MKTVTKRKSRDAELVVIKTPPNSIEAEQSVLGGLMLDNSGWDKIVDRIHENDFYLRDHRIIFNAIAILARRHKPFDTLTLTEILKEQNQLTDAGGEVYLFELAKNTPSAANITAYADIVRERAILRQLIGVANDIADDAFNPDGRESNELLDRAEQKVFAIATKHLRGGQVKRIESLLAHAVDYIDTLYHSDDPITGLPTGYADLDNKTSGLQSSELIIVAGRPSMGKTAFAMNIAEYAAIKCKKPIVVFSMEMSGESLAMRLLSSNGRIDQHKLRSGRLQDEDWPRITAAVSMLSEAPIYIDDTPALSPAEIRSRARRLSREHGQLGLIIVDYLQLMQVPGSKENRTTEISEISRNLKALAKELNVPIMALSQLNRSLEQRNDKRPVMSDLRECVTGDTLVVLADGKRLPIKELVGQEPEVVAVSAQGELVTARSDKIWRVGVKPVIKLSLDNGLYLQATEEHRVLTATGWQKIIDLKVEDEIAVAYHELGLQWEKITSLQPVGEQEVYDLTVPEVESWLADGIVSHNSGAIEQDADMILFVYRDEVYNEDSSDKGIAEIIIGKQRNGPIGKVRLTFLGKYTRFENFAQNNMEMIGAIDPSE